MASVTAGYDPFATSGTWRRSRAKIGVYVVLTLFAAYYLLPLFVVILNSFREIPEIASERPDRLAAELPVRRLDRRLGHLLRRRNLRGDEAELLQLAQDDDPGDDHLDRHRGDQRLHPVEVAVQGVGGPLHLHAARRVHAGADRADALGVHPRQARADQPHRPAWSSSTACRGFRFTTLFCRNYYLNIPDDLIKAARIDGAGFWRIFRRIILPLSPPILIVTVIWQFTGIWNEFLYAVVFSSGREQPITAALIALTANGTTVRNYDVMSAAVLIGALPPLLIYFFGGRYFIRGLTQGAIK